MHFIADTHIHSIACNHAYSTITENIIAAKVAGLRFMALTEHAPAMPDAPHKWFFMNLHTIPDMMDGVAVLKGVEANIIDIPGHLDLEDGILESLDWVIASLHSPCFKPMTADAHTTLWKNMAKNINVDVIGHCGNGAFPFDFEEGVKAFKEYGKIVELNNSSILGRQGSKKNCAEIALLCKKYEVPVVVNSDAHYHLEIGKFPLIETMLAELDFPETLVINADFDRFAAIVREKTKGRISL